MGVNHDSGATFASVFPSHLLVVDRPPVAKSPDNPHKLPQKQVQAAENACYSTACAHHQQPPSRSISATCADGTLVAPSRSFSIGDTAFSAATPELPTALPTFQRHRPSACRVLCVTPRRARFAIGTLPSALCKVWSTTLASSCLSTISGSIMSDFNFLCSLPVGSWSLACAKVSASALALFAGGDG